MKKLTALLLATLMAASITACTEQGTIDPGMREQIDDEFVEEIAEDDESEEKEETEKVEKKDNKTEKVEKTDNKKDKETNKLLPDIDKVVLVDTDECSITLTGTKIDDIWGPVIKLTLENKTDDVTLNFDINEAYVNDSCTSLFLYTDVAPGKKANEEVSLYTDDLVKYGLEKITKIDIAFEVTDVEAEWDDEPIAYEEVTIYTEGKDNAESFTVGDSFIDDTLVDNEYLTINLLDSYNDDIWGFCMDIEIINNCDATIEVDTEDCSVNGYMLDPFLWSTLPEGRSVIETLSWSKEDLEDNEIEEVEEIELTFIVGDAEDYTVEYSKDTVEITY